MQNNKLFWTLFLLVLFFQTVFSAEKNSFYFVQITDTHWGDGDNLERTKKIVEKINCLPMQIECVIHTGDVSVKPDSQSLLDSGLAIMKTLKFPVYYVPGNWDISEKNFENNVQSFTRNFGNVCIRIDSKNISFVTLYNFEIKDTSGRLVYDPIMKLDSLLKNKPAALPAIIFQHNPMIDDFYKNEFHTNWAADKRMKVQKVCEANNVKAIICGHFHRDEFQWIDTIPIFVSAPITGSWGRQACFRIYHYENGKISYSTQFL